MWYKNVIRKRKRKRSLHKQCLIIWKIAADLCHVCYSVHLCASVDLAADKRLRKLRSSTTESTVTGDVYSKKLRRQWVVVVHSFTVHQSSVISSFGSCAFPSPILGSRSCLETRNGLSAVRVQAEQGHQVCSNTPSWLAHHSVAVYHCCPCLALPLHHGLTSLHHSLTSLHHSLTSLHV